MEEKNLEQESLIAVTQLFKALSDPTRLKILLQIAQGEIAVNDIALAIDAKQSTVSHQLRLLKQANLVKTRREGTTIFYTVDDIHVIEILNQTIAHVSHQ
ncbi:ArsR/SmtB family transcription factor [Brochothrix thermosphacta]|uniref:ArsR/SmtB family transcription factor n=1 Tax=Brochothrix thermosphacta TaxID=2756 RepID=UPI00083FC146|nr:metalloregulator ArsR/SmtB family transcription factor [Brochothrix thermosphacta]SLN01536.1 Transcriptional regulator, ArsR family [Brachybacterium faecium]ODJ52396.1 transcriptional regulator [Brochothrix thermosphacta]ODJ63186.1 transcriptional regulator [Brochothrix thermosphacta]ODJ65931.1 transcriptional regulator [Brochothrix thermosphacta]SOC27766.1 transcriptional regulator (multiple metal-sensing ArsR-SmtB transcriptional repressors family) [Brochothrix thermosphacta]